ncbi:uncharacterized protein B4U80_03667, partial [Leptotrombidium deliense]
GDFPDLIRAILFEHLNICEKIGLKNYVFEIVTEKAICIKSNSKVRLTVVNNEYVTTNHTLFKARNLQFALEFEGNSYLKNDDYIVHLDEDSLMTKNAIIGIINFVAKAKYDFGHGVILYSKDILNWWIMIHESIKVATDYGCIQFQFRLFHKLLYLWKGSFIVARVGAERNVGFDHGIEPSIAEDNFFGLKASSMGYTFDFIDGEVFEFTTITLKDFFKQRQRWALGSRLNIMSPLIPLQFKVFYAAPFLASWVYVLIIPYSILRVMHPIPLDNIFDFLLSFTFCVELYSKLFGAIKQLLLSNRRNIFWGLLSTILLHFIPVTFIIEVCAVFSSFFIRNLYFHVTKKSVNQQCFSNSINA